MMNRFFTMPESPICPLCGFGTDDWLILDAHFKEHHNISDHLDASTDGVMSSPYCPTHFCVTKYLKFFQEIETKKKTKIYFNFTFKLKNCSKSDDGQKAFEGGARAPSCSTLRTSMLCYKSNVFFIQDSQDEDGEAMDYTTQDELDQDMTVDDGCDEGLA